MNGYFNIPLIIFLIYFLYCLTSWNISISFSQTVKENVWASELERKMWLSNSFFSLYCLIVNKILPLFSFLFIAFFAYKSNIFSAVLLFFIPLIPVSFASRVLKQKIPLPILALIGVVVSPVLLLFLTLLTQWYFRY